MSATVATAETTADESVMQSVADAMRDAATTASDHAERVKASFSGAGPRALRSLSRATYTGAYVISYGLTYGAVFAVSSLPQNNPLMHGFRDGGAAAVDALKKR